MIYNLTPISNSSGTTNDLNKSKGH